MSDWRDDLPEIPSERIRREAIHEGHRRREARLQRQSAVLFGSMGVAAVALIVFAIVSISPGAGDDDDDAATDTSTGGTDSPGTTAAAAGTSAAPGTTGATETTGAAGRTVPDYTTIGGPIGALPPNPAVMVVTSTNLWEQPASGPDCGPTLLTVVFDPGSTPQSPVVHWETAGVREEAPMEIAAGTGVREIGPFPAETLEVEAIHEVLVYVTDADASGDQIFRAPTVVLRDCSP